MHIPNETDFSIHRGQNLTALRKPGRGYVFSCMQFNIEKGPSQLLSEQLTRPSYTPYSHTQSSTPTHSSTTSSGTRFRSHASTPTCRDLPCSLPFSWVCP